MAVRHQARALGTFADSYANAVWLKNNLQNALLTLLGQVGNIPYNPAGYGLIEAAMLDPINAALNYGAIRSGVLLSAAQIAEVNNAGRACRSTRRCFPRGWYVQIVPAPATVRGVRGSPETTLWFTDGDSVQKINVSSQTIVSGNLMGNDHFANAALTLAVANVFSSPQTLQGWDVDNAFDIEMVDFAEDKIGVDGILSAGYIYNLVPMTLHLPGPTAPRSRCSSNGSRPKSPNCGDLSRDHGGIASHPSGRSIRFRPGFALKRGHLMSSRCTKSAPAANLHDRLAVEPNHRGSPVATRAAVA